MTRKVVALAALAVSLSALMSGCGTTPASTGMQHKTGVKVSAKDYSSVTQAQRIASNALYQYSSLRSQWQNTSDDNRKDQLEQQMLNVLTRAASDVRQTASYGSGWDARQVYNIADRGISRYESLRYQWQNTSDISAQRDLVNQMLSVLTQALQDVKSVQPSWN